MTLRDALLRGKRRPRNLGGGSPTVYRGDGYEFVELRAYVPGDDVRRIDWAATARASQLQTRVILEDVALTLAAIVDLSPSMGAGRFRSLRAAAHEAVAAWFGSALAEDRCIRVSARGATPPALQRNARGVLETLRDDDTPFEATRTLATARAVLPPGTALLAIGDWFDLGEADDALLAQVGRRFDATALIARDPWHDGLPLDGVVRLRGAEGGRVRCYIGKREREAYAAAVRRREATLLERFARAGWRTGVLHESDGAASLTEAFGLSGASGGRRW